VKHAKKDEKITHMSFKKKRQAADTGYESGMLDLIHRFFKVAIEFNELKEMLKKIKYDDKVLSNREYH